jgi:hypothetical protein
MFIKIFEVKRLRNYENLYIDLNPMPKFSLETIPGKTNIL